MLSTKDKENIIENIKNILKNCHNIGSMKIVIYFNYENKVHYIPGIKIVYEINENIQKQAETGTPESK